MRFPLEKRDSCRLVSRIRDVKMSLQCVGFVYNENGISDEKEFYLKTCAKDFLLSSF